MGLRNRIPDTDARYHNPVLGADFRKSADDLQQGEAELLQNCYYDAGLRKRLGAARLTPAALSTTLAGRGGHRFYTQAGNKRRLIAYDTKISSIADATGAETVLANSLTSDMNVHFRTWSITDTCYVTNSTDGLFKIDNTFTFATVTGTNIPVSPVMAVPFYDRLFAIQGSYVSSTNPRIDTVWAPTTSSWAVYRPFAASGNPTALHVHSATGASGDPIAQLLIFQGSSLTALTGTDFGSDVTAASPPGTWNAVLTVLDPRIGTNSPYSVVTVAGLGTFWFTADANVAWLPFGEKNPRLIGDSLYTFRTDVKGINNVNQSQLGQVLMVYHDRKLKLYLPVVDQTYSTLQYWLDLRPLQAAVSAPLSGVTTEQQFTTSQISWSCPHIGQSIRRVWIEAEAGDPALLYGLEGNASHGLYVYELNPIGVYKDDVGANSNDVTFDYRSFYSDFGWPAHEKWLPEIRFDVSGYINNATVTVRDLHGSLATGMSIVRQDGSAFTNNSYGNGLRYGNGAIYGSQLGNNIGYARLESQSSGGLSMLGDAIQIEVSHTTGPFEINSMVPQVMVRKTQPVG